MHFDPWTLGLQAANFLVLLWLLHRFLYRPVLAIIAQRQAEAAKLTGEVQAQKQAIEAQRQALEREQAELAAQRETALTAAREAVEAERKTLLAKAHAEAEAVRAEAGKSFERERAEIVASVGRDAARLAVAIATRLLGEVPAGELQARMLDQICEDVGALPAETRRRMAERLTDRQDTPQVVTATPLDAAAAARFTERLGAALGAPASPAFQVDPALIVGVELRFPFTILRRTWADSLRRIEAGLTDDAAPVA
jgi:F-type H+-transporting ATPase subunit b